MARDQPPALQCRSWRRAPAVCRHPTASVSQASVPQMFVECLMTCVLGNRDEAVTKTDNSTQNLLCKSGLSFPI